VSAEHAPDTATPVVRRLAAEDVRAVWELLQAAPEAADWSESSIRNSQFDNKNTSLVSILNEDVVGCIFAMTVAGEAEILNLAVKPSHRRRGIGRALVRQLLAEWERQRILRVFLEVRESNFGAMKLYESLGFREFGRRKAYYSSPQEDALVLERA
jgi:ribosomal-protein-alanine N-acetyltransferase